MLKSLLVLVFLISSVLAFAQNRRLTPEEIRARSNALSGVLDTQTAIIAQHCNGGSGQIRESSRIENGVRVSQRVVFCTSGNQVVLPSGEPVQTPEPSAPFPEADLRRCVATFMAAKTQTIMSEKLLGADSDEARRTNQAEWVDQCQGDEISQLSQEITDKLRFIEQARASWNGQPSPEMQECLAKVKNNQISDLIVPLGSNSQACINAIRPRLVGVLTPVLESAEILNGGAESFCRKVIGAHVEGDALNSQERESCKVEVPQTQVSIVNPTVSQDECRSALDEALKDLIKDDQKNILGLQFELTTLKLARLTQQEGLKTFEGLVKKKQSALQQMDNGTRDRLKEAYRLHGKIEDSNLIEAKISELATQSSQANYARGSQRFYAEQTSAFLLALSASEPQSGLDESDVAISWFMNQVQQRIAEKNGKFSAAHNLTNFSNQVAALSGYIDPSKAVGPAVLESRQAQVSQELQGVLQSFADNFKQSNPQCFDGDIFSGTGQCWGVASNVLPSFMRTLSHISNEVKTAEGTQVEMIRRMGAKVSGYPLYFNRLALRP